MQAEIIIALDVPSSKSILGIINSLPKEISFYKVGLELFTSEGPNAFLPLKSAHCRIFLDLKLHDIPRTVANTVKTAASHGVNILTVHSLGGKDMLKAAAQAAKECGTNAPKLVAVTTLTSLNENDLKDIGINRPLKQHTLAMGELAINCGIDGLVCSPLEATEFRKILGPNPILITPGVRPAGADVGDQKRIATPGDAVRAGANYLVIGRPILNAKDPASAAKSILDEISKA